jgi:hypothetical protein
LISIQNFLADNKKKAKKLDTSISETKIPDSSGVFDMDVPATPSPCKIIKSSFKTPPHGKFTAMRKKPLENKQLDVIRKSSRARVNQSMFASPSIMSYKAPSNAVETSVSVPDDSSNENINRSSSLVLMDLDMLFDELKNTQDHPKAIADESSESIRKSIQISADIQQVATTKEDKSNGFDSKLDWSNINVEAFHQLKRKAASYRPIIEELEKAK